MLSEFEDLDNLKRAFGTEDAKNCEHKVLAPEEKKALLKKTSKKLLIYELNKYPLHPAYISDDEFEFDLNPEKLYELEPQMIKLQGRTYLWFGDNKKEIVCSRNGIYGLLVSQRYL